MTVDSSRKLAIAVLLDLVKHGSANDHDIKLCIACLNYLGVCDQEIYAALDISEEEISQNINNLKEIIRKYELINKDN